MTNDDEFDLAQTEKLEAELKSISEQLEVGKFRFHQVRQELSRRRAAKDDQPAPLTDDERNELNKANADAVDRNLVLKITSMELEQARLVIEAETAKADAQEARDRLALVCKHAAAGTLKTYMERFIAAPRATAPRSPDPDLIIHDGPDLI